MSDSPGTPDSPDFLDRLIARHVAPRPAAVRVRPRLPGPFERVEAVRQRAADPEEDTLLWPAVTPAAPPADGPRTAAPGTRTHTEREHTVVRTEREPAGPDPRPSAPARAEAPLPHPAAPVAPGPRPQAGARRAAGRGRAAQPEPAQNAVSPPMPPGAETAPHAVSAAPRPSAADTAAARDAVRQAAARRPARTTEQVVQVQIGRLEVTAQPSGGERRRTPAKERAGTTLSLAEYLARGRE